MNLSLTNAKGGFLCTCFTEHFLKATNCLSGIYLCEQLESGLVFHQSPRLTIKTTIGRYFNRSHWLRVSHQVNQHRNKNWDAGSSADVWKRVSVPLRLLDYLYLSGAFLSFSSARVNYLSNKATLLYFIIWFKLLSSRTRPPFLFTPFVFSFNSHFLLFHTSTCQEDAVNLTAIFSPGSLCP